MSSTCLTNQFPAQSASDVQIYVVSNSAKRSLGNFLQTLTSGGINVLRGILLYTTCLPGHGSLHEQQFFILSSPRDIM